MQKFYPFEIITEFHRDNFGKIVPLFSLDFHAPVR